MSWNTPDTDGWHWLRDKLSGEYCIARYRNVSPRTKEWWLLSPHGYRYHHNEHHIIADFTYIGPIEEPAP